MSQQHERSGGAGPGRPIREGEHRTDEGAGRRVTGDAREAPPDAVPPSASDPAQAGEQGGEPRALNQYDYPSTRRDPRDRGEDER